MESMESQLRKIEKRLDRAAKFGKINAKELKRANRDAAKQYIPIQRAMIRPYNEDIEIRPGLVVKKKQLWNSIGVWFPRGRNDAFAGPRANRAGRKTLKRKVRESADGWFAHIVEMGARPATMKKGGKRGGAGIRIQTPNTGVFEKAIRLSMPKVKMKQTDNYRKEFKRYMR